jgi:hypothetical protein
MPLFKLIARSSIFVCNFFKFVLKSVQKSDTDGKVVEVIMLLWSPGVLLTNMGDISNAEFLARHWQLLSMYG